MYRYIKGGINSLIRYIFFNVITIMAQFIILCLCIKFAINKLLLGLVNQMII